MNRYGPDPIAGWTHVYSGKVRDLYVPIDASVHSGSDVILVVASDRISVFDRVMPTPIPGKGRVVTQFGLWWFRNLSGMPNHVLSEDVPAEVAGRAFIARRMRQCSISTRVYGYLSGAAFDEYQQTGQVAGHQLPKGLVEAQKLPEPIVVLRGQGQNQPLEYVTPKAAAYKLGRTAVVELIKSSAYLYSQAATLAEKRGLIIADVHLECGHPMDHGEGGNVWSGEGVTPDSAVIWALDDYEPGRPQASFGKEPVRQWLREFEAQQAPEPLWDLPEIPVEVVEATKRQYQTVIRMLKAID